MQDSLKPVIAASIFLLFVMASCDQDKGDAIGEAVDAQPSTFSFLLKKSLELEELGPFLPKGEQDSLFILSSIVPSEFKMSRKGLTIVPVPDGAFKERFLSIHSPDIFEDFALIRFRYPANGLYCEVFFRRDNKEWVVLKSQVSIQ